MEIITKNHSVFLLCHYLFYASRNFANRCVSSSYKEILKKKDKKFSNFENHTCSFEATEVVVIGALGIFKLISMPASSAISFIRLVT